MGIQVCSQNETYEQTVSVDESMESQGACRDSTQSCSIPAASVVHFFRDVSNWLGYFQFLFEGGDLLNQTVVRIPKGNAREKNICCFMDRIKMIQCFPISKGTADWLLIAGRLVRMLILNVCKRLL